MQESNSKAKGLDRDESEEASISRKGSKLKEVALVAGITKKLASVLESGPLLYNNSKCCYILHGHRLMHILDAYI